MVEIQKETEALGPSYSPAIRMRNKQNAHRNKTLDLKIQNLKTQTNQSIELFNELLKRQEKMYRQVSIIEDEQKQMEQIAEEVQTRQNSFAERTASIISTHEEIRTNNRKLTQDCEEINNIETNILDDFNMLAFQLKMIEERHEEIKKIAKNVSENAKTVRQNLQAAKERFKLIEESANIIQQEQKSMRAIEKEIKEKSHIILEFFQKFKKLTQKPIHLKIQWLFFKFLNFGFIGFFAWRNLTKKIYIMALQFFPKQ